MKINVSIEVPDELEPCTCGCEAICPLSYWGADDSLMCTLIMRDDNGELYCLLSKGEM